MEDVLGVPVGLLVVSLHPFGSPRDAHRDGMDRRKGDSVLRKEMSYCFSLDRYVERLKDNSNDY